MRVLVLGSTGFLGRCLVDELRRARHEVEGWARSASDGEGSRRVDLDLDATLPVPRAAWDAAVLLAGPSVPARFSAAVEGAATLRITQRALDHLARHAPAARIVVASSAHVLAPRVTPIDESAPHGESAAQRVARGDYAAVSTSRDDYAAVSTPRGDYAAVPTPRGDYAAVSIPRGDYAATKTAVEALVRERSAVQDLVVARLFGSLGPDLPAGLFVPDLLDRLARGERHIVLRGPDAVRDLTDGRDVARALRLLIETPLAESRVFHVGTGRGLRLSDLAARIVSASGCAATLEFAEGLGPSWIADPTRLASATGWTPRHELADTIAWTLAGSALAPRGAP